MSPLSSLSFLPPSFALSFPPLDPFFLIVAYVLLASPGSLLISLSFTSWEKPKVRYGYAER